ncbi:hypothetical protein [Microbacterium sp. 179-I 3D4 NHS]|uniref:DUF7882 family protein n=1 Tax=Microbacterium sp. 179-I 3D4 NHS TaxID=3142381 RepID=UPI0039A2B920
MGHLNYGNSAARIEMDDTVLGHLRAVAVTKLRRKESFALTIPMKGGAVETLWVHASIPLRFVMGEEVSLHRPLLTAMMEAASSASGLDLTDKRIAEAAPGQPEQLDARRPVEQSEPQRERRLHAMSA